VRRRRPGHGHDRRTARLTLYPLAIARAIGRNVPTADLKRIQRSLNNQPRKTLGYLTPSEADAQIVASTA